MWIALGERKETAVIDCRHLDVRRSKAHLMRMAKIIADYRSATAQLRGYAVSLLLVAVSTLVGLVVAPRWGNSAVDLLFLPAVLGAAVFAGLGPALLAAFVAALA